MEHNVPEKKTNKQYIVIIAVAVVVLVGVGIFMFKGSSPSTNQQPAKKLENTDLIPTVDSSVKVDIKPTNNKKELVITVSNMPKGTQSVDYELSYQTVSQGLQGIIGTVTPKENATDFSEFEKKVTLGTCSSGTCVYHQVTGPIKASLKFTGSYGERLYEKDYTI